MTQVLKNAQWVPFEMLTIVFIQEFFIEKLSGNIFYFSTPSSGGPKKD